MAEPAATLDDWRKASDESPAISVIAENRLPVHAACADVVDSTRELESRSARHANEARRAAVEISIRDGFFAFLALS